MRNAIFVDFEERNTASVDVWVIFGSFSKEERHDLAKPRASSIYIYLLRRYVTSLKTEQFIHELAQFNEDTGKSTEARMDIIAEMPNLRAMLDIRVFLSTGKQWNSTRWNEMQKHLRLSLIHI